MSLRVASRCPPALELLAQLAVVVDLTVLDDVNRSVLVGDRLIAALEIDDGQAPRSKADPVLHERAAAVGPAMQQRLIHLVQRRSVDRRRRSATGFRRCRT